MTNGNFHFRIYQSSISPVTKGITVHAETASLDSFRTKQISIKQNMDSI